MTTKRFKRKLNKILEKTLLRISKRHRFVISTFILTTIIYLSQYIGVEKIFLATFFLAILTYILSLWCLWEELTGIEFLTLFVLPVLFTSGVFLFYFLLPLRLIIKIPVALLYAIGMYAIFLSENIFNVAAIRTIALLRAAKSVGMLFSLIALFFLINTLFSFHAAFYINFLLVLFISFLIIISLFWSEKLNEAIDKDTFIFSLGSSVIVAELALLISFFPIKATFASLYITSLFYTFLGIGQNKIREMPVKRSLWEFALLNILALFMLFRMSVWEI